MSENTPMAATEADRQDASAWQRGYDYGRGHDDDTECQQGTLTKITLPATAENTAALHGMMLGEPTLLATPHGDHLDVHQPKVVVEPGTVGRATCDFTAEGHVHPNVRVWRLRPGRVAPWVTESGKFLREDQVTDFVPDEDTKALRAELETAQARLDGMTRHRDLRERERDEAKRYITALQNQTDAAEERARLAERDARAEHAEAERLRAQIGRLTEERAAECIGNAFQTWATDSTVRDAARRVVAMVAAEPAQGTDTQLATALMPIADAPDIENVPAASSMHVLMECVTEIYGGVRQIQEALSPETQAERMRALAPTAVELMKELDDGAVPLPDRDQIARTVHQTDIARADATTDRWVDLSPAMVETYYAHADAVLALMPYAVTEETLADAITEVGLPDVCTMSDTDFYAAIREHAKAVLGHLREQVSRG